jgi:hypothetical protein
MQLTSPIFHSGAVEVRRDVWSDGLLEMGAIMKSWVLTDGQSRFACDAETLESVTLHVSELQQELIGMIAALGAVVSQVRDDAVPAGTMANIGYLIGGLSTLQADLNTALDWMRPAPGYSPVGDMQLISKDGAAQIRAPASTANALPKSETKEPGSPSVAPFVGASGRDAHWYDMDPTDALAELAKCRAVSGDDDVKAGARFARSMLQSILSTGAPKYDAQAFDIQTFFAVAARDSASEDFVTGFTMGIAVCLATDLGAYTTSGGHIDWDPVDELIQAGICDASSEPATPKPRSVVGVARQTPSGRSRAASAVAA